MSGKNSVSATKQSNSVPEYDRELSLYHRAFEPELRKAIGDLRLAAGAAVLDVPCGDGFYTRLLANQVGESGRVVGADALTAYLERGECAAAAADVDEQTEFVEADAYRLPFANQTFDTVWCAQSFISLDAPVAALREFRRVLKPEGFVAVLESDEFHHVVLPWPVEFELSLQAAFQAASREEYGKSEKTYVSRRMRRWLSKSGFEAVVRTSYTADRHQPLDSATRPYLEVHLRELADFVRKYLQPGDREMLERLTAPASPDYLLAGEDLELLCLFSVWRAVVAP